MEKILSYLKKIPTLLWLVIILVVMRAEIYITTLYEAKKIHATESLAGGLFDTTTAPRYCGELRMKRVSGDTAYYWYNCRSSGRKWFRLNPTVGPDTLINLGALDTLLVPQNTNKFGWKSIRTTSSDLTVTPTIDANQIAYDITLAGTLQANRSIAGNGKTLDLGTGGSNLLTLTVNASGDLVVNSGIKESYPTYSTDAITSLSANAPTILLDDAGLSANRVITLPTGSVGSRLIVANKGNNASFFYQFSPTPTDNTTAGAITNIGHRTSYYLMKDAGGWRILFKY